MRSQFEIKDFDACIEKVKVTSKLPSSAYMDDGEYPIVSQEKELISGYWNKAIDLFTHSRPDKL